MDEMNAKLYQYKTNSIYAERKAKVLKRKVLESIRTFMFHS